LQKTSNAERPTSNAEFRIRKAQATGLFVRQLAETKKKSSRSETVAAKLPAIAD
jgi:hypothetical protein